MIKLESLTQKYSKLVLASASEQRLKLLRQMFPAFPIEVIVSGQDEVSVENESPVKRVLRLALAKSMDVASRHANDCVGSLVIGADTEIVLDGKAFGKPEDDSAATTMLQALSGKCHYAITGYAIVDPDTKIHVVDYSSTEVRFKNLSRETIERYVLTGEPIGKAGAYGIQGHGATLIADIIGSYSNVVGLPVEQLVETLVSLETSLNAVKLTV